MDPPIPTKNVPSIISFNRESYLYLYLAGWLAVCDKVC